MITYLHHTSPSLPKYAPESWTYLRGALATVDRNLGPVLPYMFHHIVDLHVVHHLFPYVATAPLGQTHCRFLDSVPREREMPNPLLTDAFPTITPRRPPTPSNPSLATTTT